jgi:hypothetical protein
VRHARPEDLDRLESLLARLRAFSVLKEKSRGVFYLKSQAFLHFHADPAGLFADVRGEDGAFERVKVDEPEGEAALLDKVARALS